LTLTLSAVANSDCRLTSLRDQLRFDQLKSEERASIVAICEVYNDIFHLPNEKLTCTSTSEHAIYTPTIDPHRAINVKPYRIPKVHRMRYKGRWSKCYHTVLCNIVPVRGTPPISCSQEIRLFW